jgi:hypothetical protein
VVGEFGEGRQFEELLARGRLVDDLVLENPGEIVRDEDSVEASAQGRIDVGSRAVADHPGRAGIARIPHREIGISGVVLFGEDLDCGEVGSEAGAMEFIRLLGGVSLGDEDEPVPRGEIGERGGDPVKQFDLLVGNGLGKTLDTAMFLRCNGTVRQLLKTADERAAKALKPVAMGQDGVVLDSVEMLANFFRSVDAMIEVGDEAGDGALEIDVVFPKSVVGVDEESLIDGATKWLNRGDHEGNYKGAYREKRRMEPIHLSRKKPGMTAALRCGTREHMAARPRWRVHLACHALPQTSDGYQSCADVRYRMWNSSAVQRRQLANGRYDEVAKGFVLELRS